MIKSDEIELMRIAIECEPYEASCLYSYVNDSKRMHYILRKWDDRGWWDYGVSLRTGWLTEYGKEAISDIINTVVEGGA